SPLELDPDEVNSYLYTLASNKDLSDTYFKHAIYGLRFFFRVYDLEDRRFAAHILPFGFIRIRHYGFLASKNKAKELNIAKVELKQSVWVKQKYSWIEICQQKLDYNPLACTQCGAEKIIIMKVILPERGPPIENEK
ncbi:transposase, partial [Marivirga sp.]|uniref:transposase n=1 Tax=Marivirga sp. TaxID=2018662 RepID=UPI002D800DD7